MDAVDEDLMAGAVIEAWWPAAVALALLGVLLLLLALRARRRAREEAAERRRQWREVTDRYVRPSGHLLN